jgi:APA family basic amino acid/polyamine antiporter
MQQGKNELGLWMCTALVVGNTIGMGIYVLPSSLAPFGFNAMLGWAITVFGMSVLARVFAQLAREFPKADGPYAYIERTSGKLPAFIAIWCYWISCWMTNAALAVGVVGYLGTVLPSLAALPPAALAIALIWVFVGVNLLGVRMGGGVQIVTTVIKLLPLVFILGLGALLLVTEPATYTRQLPTTPITLAGMMAAATIALFAMTGIESAAVPAGRVRDPEKTVPRATLLGTLVVAIVYFGVSSIAILLIQQDELAKSSAPFADLLDRFVGEGNGRLLSVFIVVGGLGALNGWTLLVSELTATMARHGSLPAPLERCNSQGAPYVALIVTALLATAIVLMNYSKSMVEGFTFLTQVVTAANLPLYLFCAIALVVLSLRGERKLPASLLALGIIGTAYAVFSFIGLGHEPFLWSLVLGAAGLPIYWLLHRRRATVAT